MVINKNLLNTYERDQILYGKSLKLENIKNKIRESIEKKICSAFMKAFIKYDYLDQDSTFSFRIPKTKQSKLMEAIQEEIFNNMRASGWIIEEINLSHRDITGYHEKRIIKFSKKNLFLDYDSEIRL